MYKIVRVCNGKLCALSENRIYEEGVRYEGVYFAHYNLSLAVVDARGFAEVFGHVLVYEVDAEPLPKLPSRFPTLGAPERLRRQWAELVGAGRIEDSEQLFAGELEIYTYPLVAVTLVKSFVLRRPILRFRRYFDDLRKKYRYEVTILAPDVDETLVRAFCAGWEVSQYEEEERTTVSV